MRRFAILPLIMAVACAGPMGTGVAGPDGVGLRRWGDGPYGLVLVPDTGRDAASWAASAEVFAADGMTVVAVEEADAAGVASALRYLLEELGLERAALMGAGEGAEVALRVTESDPGLVDQLIVISPRGRTGELGEFPKLFVASEGEEAAADAERMAAEAAGTWNELYLAPGDDSGQAILEGEGREGAMEAIGRRLDERR